MTKNNEQIEKIYICNYGQTEFPVCVDLGHEYCKLDFQKSKECNLRAVVSYDDYLRKEQECEELKDELLMINCMTTTQCMENGRLYEQLDQLKKELASTKGLLNTTSKSYGELLLEFDKVKEEKEKLEGEISHCEHDLGWCSSLIDVYEEKIMKCFYALQQIQLHNLKIKDKDIHLILKEVKEDLKEYNKMKNEELDKKVKNG